jgi:hypothetical protein
MALVTARGKFMVLESRPPETLSAFPAVLSSLYLPYLYPKYVISDESDAYRK